AQGSATPRNTATWRSASMATTTRRQLRWLNAQVALERRAKAGAVAVTGCMIGATSLHNVPMQPEVRSGAHPAAAAAGLVLIAASRCGLPWLAALCIGVGIGLAAFLSEVAVTEARELQLAVVAAWLRACAVFLVAAHVAARTLREIDDKALELTLA